MTCRGIKVNDLFGGSELEAMQKLIDNGVQRDQALLSLITCNWDLQEAMDACGVPTETHPATLQECALQLIGFPTKYQGSTVWINGTGPATAALREIGDVLKVRQSQLKVMVGNERVLVQESMEPLLLGLDGPLKVTKIRAETCYAVWVNPAEASTAGIWIGGPRAWVDIENSLPGKRYCYKDGTRLKGLNSPTEAVEAYRSEADKHGAPLPPPVHVR